ncbi:MAG: YbaK/EbsC family protein [Terriglobales bacterium]
MAPKPPVTSAVRWLRERGVSYREHLYDYIAHGGTAVSAAVLGMDEHAVIKTLVLADDRGELLLMLMHGDREVSLRELARQLGKRSLEMARPEVAERATGYQFGGTSPFGTRRALAVAAEATIAALPRLVINGGKRGFLVELSGADLWPLLHPIPVTAARPPERGNLAAP